jgi:outer membrane protein TolC
MNVVVWFRVAVVALLATLAPAVNGPARAAERPLTLEEAIARALEKNESILIERQSLAAADAAVSGAYGAYDPVLELQSGWRRTVDPVNSAFSGAPAGRDAPTAEVAEAGAAVRQLLRTGGVLSLRANASRGTTDGAFDLLSPAYGTQVGVELRQPLLRDRGVDVARFTVRAAGADRERTAAVLEREVSETVAAVERAYWTLAAARSAVGVREEAVRHAEEQLAETEVRIEHGASPKTEIAQPRAEVERRRGELLAAREAAARAENALKLLILSDADGELWLERLAPAADAPVEVAAVDVAAAIERALASRPELEAAAAAIERRRAATAFAREGVRPALDAVLSYDRYGLSGTLNGGAGLPGFPGGVPTGLEGDFGRSLELLGDGDFENARVALVLGVPLGNRAARAAALGAESAERQSEADRTRLRKTIRAEVLDAAAALETAGQRIEAARAGREAAEVQLAAERERFAVGLSTNFLVLTRQNDLARARLDEISALTDYRTARTELGRATGALLDERSITLAAVNGGPS